MTSTKFARRRNARPTPPYCVAPPAGSCFPIDPTLITTAEIYWEWSFPGDGDHSQWHWYAHTHLALDDEGSLYGFCHPVPGANVHIWLSLSPTIGAIAVTFRGNWDDEIDLEENHANNVPPFEQPFSLGRFRHQELAADHYTVYSLTS